jgi:hypothetical protein
MNAAQKAVQEANLIFITLSFAPPP